MSAAEESRQQREARTFLISVAAELAGMHAQTLRTYDRLGLVSPSRSPGGDGGTQSETSNCSAKFSGFPKLRASTSRESSASSN